MLLTDYIDSVYGTARGNRARFLKDNPDILPQELSLWLKAGLKTRPETGEIYKPVLRLVRIPSAVAAGAGVLLSDDLRERVASLATAQNVTSDAMLNALVALALARQKGDVLSPTQENLFLTRWLATALKQRRFSRDVTPDIEWRVPGVQAE